MCTEVGSTILISELSRKYFRGGESMSPVFSVEGTKKLCCFGDERRFRIVVFRGQGSPLRPPKIRLRNRSPTPRPSSNPLLLPLPQTPPYLLSVAWVAFGVTWGPRCCVVVGPTRGARCHSALALHWVSLLFLLLSCSHRPFRMA